MTDWLYYSLLMKCKLTWIWITNFSLKYQFDSFFSLLHWIHWLKQLCSFLSFAGPSATTAHDGLNQQSVATGRSGWHCAIAAPSNPFVKIRHCGFFRVEAWHSKNHSNCCFAIRAGLWGCQAMDSCEQCWAAGKSSCVLAICGTSENSLMHMPSRHIEMPNTCNYSISRFFDARGSDIPGWDLFGWLGEPHGAHGGSWSKHGSWLGESCRVERNRCSILPILSWVPDEKGGQHTTCHDIMISYSYNVLSPNWAMQVRISRLSIQTYSCMMRVRLTLLFCR